MQDNLFKYTCDGHVRRMEKNSMPRREFDRIDDVKRKVGRPRYRWREQIKWSIEDRGLTWEEVESERWWEDRKKWNECIHKEIEGNEGQEEENEDQEEGVKEEEEENEEGYIIITI